MNLAEKYRPKSLAEVVGQDKAVATIRRIAEDLPGSAVWIEGKSGQGKTTLAEIIAGMVADPINILRMSAGELTPAALREIERVGHCTVLGQKKGRALIVNEAHGLRADSIRYLKDFLEVPRMPKSLCVIFTTTKKESESLFGDECKEDAIPFVQRCIQISLTDQGLAPAFAARAKEIATAEGLDGKPLANYVALLNACKGSMRAALCQIQAGKMLA